MKHATILVRELKDCYRTFSLRLRNRITKKLFESTIQNLDIIQAIEGAKTSSAFERNNLRRATICKTRKDLFRHCLAASANTNGLHLEFGTYKGDSINALAKLAPDKHFFGFDSFEGLPETWTTGARKGAFSTQGKLPAVRKNVTLIKGFYEHTLPPFVRQHKTEKIAFIHIDCDLYSATKTVLENLSPMMTAGTIICFDEFYNYPEWEEGEYKAFTEFVEKYNIKFEYRAYVRTASRVVVKILTAP